ncbi:GAF domain-containing sensor histidine kinase [Alicyclobacillus mengziensis]|uniref:Oxygen sensor histidine kinase NreB n=1 Tax=Alicyclobacillus mengziensis TaxID=2931921 RepID=A0A9X7Z4R4_9BACL|nr:GAF domain-containing sensor histidine kinase [Alicyclobacillus mengziensis]QSO46204.1 GAF domain-containing sensor histidine kinase [Alicyclobacillus mengziensis]
MADKVADESANDINYKESSLFVLKAIAEALNETSDVAEAMNAILPRLSEALGLTTAWAFRYDASRRSFVEVGASGLPPALAVDDGTLLKSGWCECQDQFMHGRLSTAVNIVRCSRLRDADGDKRGLCYHASIPLRSKGKPLGILNVAAEGYQVFTQAALGLLMTIGNQVAVAIDRAGILSDERQRTRQLRAMSTFAANLVGMVRVHDILEYTVTQFVDNLGYEACGVMTVAFGPDENRPDKKSMDSSTEDSGTPSPPYAGKLVAAAHRKTEAASEYQYSYDEDLLPASSDSEQEPQTADVGFILPIAKSHIEMKVPHTEYQIRLESSNYRAFRQPDEDLLIAFAWHLSATLEHARKYDESLENAKWLERRRLAAELHDSVSQRLFSAKLLADALILASERGDAESAKAKSKFDKGAMQDSERELAKHLSSLIEDSQREMRALIETLRPVEERGWIDRLRERIAHLQLEGRTRFHLALEVPREHSIPLMKQDCLLKVIDEATGNIMRHAGAKHAHIHVWREDGRLYLTIQDDGCGFDVSSVQRGLGTSTMADRVASIGGELKIVSHPGSGTTITCYVP